MSEDPTAGENAVDWNDEFDVVQTADRSLSQHSFPTVPETCFVRPDEIAIEGRENQLPSQIGEYKLQRLLGAGGMGRVFLAEHMRMQRMVALKVLPLEHMQDARWVQGFYEEIRAASRLLHPNIVTAFDAGESSGIHYMAMEYVDGYNLSTVIAHSGPMSIGEAASVIRQAAMGLLHAHRNGIVHRDVKPGNLMRANDGTVKLLDLGLARVNLQQWASARSKYEDVEVPDPGHVKRPGRLIGTLSYMSPDQIDDPDAVDARSDIYSLGAVLFYLLTGRAPYRGEFLDIVYGHRHGEVPELMQLRDDVDLKFDHILRRMMAKSPAARYGSLDEVIDDLAPYAEAKIAPGWITDLSIRTSRGELSALSHGSVSKDAARVIGLDLGMNYIAAAEADLAGSSRMLMCDSSSSPHVRLAIAAKNEQLVFGDEAIGCRELNPATVLHSLPIFFGKQLVDRALNGTKYPPEVLVAMSIRDLLRTRWDKRATPDVTAIAIPSTYDQLRRRCVLQAAQLAGLKRVRLIDRSIAASITALASSSVAESSVNDAASRPQNESILFLGLTGSASDIAVLQCEQRRIQQLSTAGHWHLGTLRWQHVLVDHVANKVKEAYRFDPRGRPEHAAVLQRACERAMNSMLISNQARMKFALGHESIEVTVNRPDWLVLCRDLIDGYLASISEACELAKVPLESITTCVALGPLLRVPEIRERLASLLSPATRFMNVDRSDVARGASACIVAELPGRSSQLMPSRAVSSQTIGIVFNDSRGKPRILPLIPRGSVLPARTNRRLTFDNPANAMTLEIVESSGVDRQGWHSLGRHTFAPDPSQSTQTRLVSFEIDVNGLLNVRVQSHATQGSVKLPTLPTPNLSDEAFEMWAELASQN